MKQVRNRVACSLFVFVVAAVLTAPSADAGFWSKLNPFRWFSSRSRPHTLIVTGNYTPSRLLAELIQFYNGQPVLLVSPRSDGEGEDLYFLTSNGQATAIEAEKYKEFIDWLSPEHIVILGDERYVPETYEQQIETDKAVVRLPGKDWRKNAEEAARIFHIKKLPRRYDELLSRVQAAPPVAPGATSPAPPPAAVPAPAK